MWEEFWNQLLCLWGKGRKEDGENAINQMFRSLTRRLHQSGHAHLLPGWDSGRSRPPKPEVRPSISGTAWTGPPLSPRVTPRPLSVKQPAHLTHLSGSTSTCCEKQCLEAKVSHSSRSSGPRSPVCWRRRGTQERPWLSFYLYLTRSTWGCFHRVKRRVAEFAERSRETERSEVFTEKFNRATEPRGYSARKKQKMKVKLCFQPVPSFSNALSAALWVL